MYVVEKAEGNPNHDDHGRFSSGSGFSTTTPEKFLEARGKTDRPSFLAPKTVADLAGYNLLMNKEGTVGVAVGPDGDIHNLFNNGGPKGSGADAMVAAIKAGGRTLDAYAGYLPDFYHQLGFEETNRMKFFKPAAPRNWDEKLDHPDIVFMAWKGYPKGDAMDALQQAKDRTKWLPNVKSEDYINDYHAGKTHSLEAITKRRRAGSDRHIDQKLGASSDRTGNQSGFGTGQGDRRHFLNKSTPKTLYVRRNVLNADDLVAWATDQGFNTTIPADEMHVTVAFSRTPVDWSVMPDIFDDDSAKLTIGPQLGRSVVPLGPGGAVVLLFSSEALRERHDFMSYQGASWDWPSYQPHVTITFDKGDIDLINVQPYQGILVFGPEIYEEVKEDWQDGITEKVDIMEKRGARHSKSDMEMLQNIHDHAVSLGADCDHTEALEKFDATVIKVDTSLGLVFGWAVICKNHGQDYYDLNRDIDGTRCPEHITEKAMLDGATEFMQNSRVAKEMHRGDEKGAVVFAFPMTTDIAKAMGIITHTTGLMIAMKPSPEMLAKFESGEYKGFSIGGKKQEFEDYSA